ERAVKRLLAPLAAALLAASPRAADAAPPDAAKAAEGLALLRARGCQGCHSLDGAPSTGPGFLGLWGSERTVVRDGVERRVRVDEAFVRDSIRDPARDVEKGYVAGAMP